MLDTLVILHDMLQQIERYHIDKVVVQEELQHKMKVDLLQLNVRLVMDRLVTIIQTLL